jgi:hypothetical protein
MEPRTVNGADGYRFAEGADPQFTPGVRVADRLDITFPPGERQAASA